jgi:hypothetical protein
LNKNSIPPSFHKSGKPLTCQPCDVDNDCSGERWVVNNLDDLASLVSMIIMGQSAHAAYIIKELQPALPIISISQLKQEAIIKLSVQEETQSPRIGYPRWQRDGLIFEAISWIAAHQTYGANTYMKDPHISATSQGLDGLILKLSYDKTQIDQTTIIEDKCTDNPRKTFLQEVIPTFKSRHSNERCAEIISAASALLKQASVSEHDVIRMSAAVTDTSARCYRAAFSLSKDYDSKIERAKLFKDYNGVENLSQSQRVGASFITDSDMRNYIDNIANLSISYIQDLSEEASNV